MVVSGAQPLKHQRTGLSIIIFMSKSFDVLVAVHHLQPYGNQALCTVLGHVSGVVGLPRRGCTALT